MTNGCTPCLALSLLLGGCATTAAPAAMEERDATSALDFAGVGPDTLAASFRLHVLTTAKADRVVKAGDVFHNHDRYYLSLRTSRAGYVYAVLIDAQGKPTLLNPGAADQAIAAGCELRLPRAGSFAMREPHGDERIKVLATSRPLGPENRELCAELGIPCAPSPAPSAPPVCPRKGRAEAGRDIDPALQIGQANASGVAELTFSFRHEP